MLIIFGFATVCCPFARAADLTTGRKVIVIDNDAMKACEAAKAELRSQGIQVSEHCSSRFSTASDVCEFLRSSEGSIVGFDGNPNLLRASDWCGEHKQSINCICGAKAARKD
jgi:hypothetical protein